MSEPTDAHEGGSAMEWLDEILESVVPGEPVQAGLLTMVPLLGEAKGEVPYLTLDEALEAKQLQVTEVSEGGSVPELLLLNEGDREVFLLDGEELVGAKQNRVLNLTLLAPARTRLTVPVSCVEQGRWRSISREFRSSKSTLHGRGRARKMASVSRSLRVRERALSDQGAVWDDVATLCEATDTVSASAAYADVHERHGASLDEYERKLRPVDRQVGAAFLVAGRLMSVDVFEHPAVLRKLLHKLVRGVALDVIAAERMGESSRPLADETAALTALFDVLRRASATTHASPGLGEAVRLERPGAMGAALRHAGRTLHLAALPA